MGKFSKLASSKLASLLRRGKKIKATAVEPLTGDWEEADDTDTPVVITGDSPSSSLVHDSRSPSLASLSPCSVGSVVRVSESLPRGALLSVAEDEEFAAPVLTKPQEHALLASPKAPVSPPPAVCKPSTPRVGVTFDMPVEQIWSEAGIALGQKITSSLQSAKWDKRVQALKAVGGILKGADLQGMCKPGSTGMLGKGLRLDERTRSWRAACQVLSCLMCDKVMPVRLASHDLFVDVFANFEGLVESEEALFALVHLLQPVFERLGDSNLRLHESARKCVIFAAERPGLLGLGATLERLRSHAALAGKGADRMRVHFGVLDTVHALLQRFPGHRDADDEEDGESSADVWTQHDITPFIVAGMDDSLGARVRSAATTLAVTVYGTFGLEAMQPMLAGLRPAKRALLTKRFEESELELDADSDDGELLDVGDLSICGHAMLPSSRPATGLVAFPGAVEEENLMDGILEDTGMAFSSTANFQEGLLPGMPESPLFTLGFEEQRLLRELGIQVDGGMCDYDDAPLPASYGAYCGTPWRTQQAVAMEVF